ncbi:MAG: TIGR01777 family oxidoreductase [Desulfobulbaceae bacterium]
MHSLVTGGTGFIGRHLVARLDRPLVAGRNPERISALPGVGGACVWSGDTLLNTADLGDLDAIFHLAGESVFKGRWNRAKKERILQSRVRGTRNLVQSLGRMDRPPAVLVCASAIGVYGSRGDSVLTEDSPPGDDFLARVCMAWEEEAARAEKYDIRVVMIRTGVVLGSDGGALPQMLTPFRLGLGGVIGSGRQYMSWIHIDDLVGIMLHAAATETLRGPVNATAPEPVTNRHFTRTLATILGRPAFFTVPGFVLRITLGEFADVLLGSQRVMPEKISAAGYVFRHPDLAEALVDLLEDAK